MTERYRCNNDEETTSSLHLSAEETAIKCSNDHDLRVSCYCEENAWRLVHRCLFHSDPPKGNEWDYHVIFISNEDRCCPMFMQRARPKDPREYVCWDYHVIVLRTRKIGVEKIDRGNGTNYATSEILDIDTWLTPYPCPLEKYLNGTFPHVDDELDPKYSPCFRVVPAKDYLKYFYSDRMHMYEKTTGEWKSPPPSYKPIMNGLESITDQYQKLHEVETGKKGNNISNLESYINMSERYQSSESLRKYGLVMTIGQLRAKYIT